MCIEREREVDRLDTSELDLAKSRMIERHERSWVDFVLHFFSLCVCAEDPSMPQPNADYPAAFNCNIRQPWEKVSIHWSMNGKASGDPILWPVESIELGKLMTKTHWNSEYHIFKTPFEGWFFAKSRLFCGSSNSFMNKFVGLIT